MVRAIIAAIALLTAPGGAKIDPAYGELLIQLRDPRTAPMGYWQALGICETGTRGIDGVKRPDWKNGGQWAGGLGIYTKYRLTREYVISGAGTWERWGGDYSLDQNWGAPSPDKATQIQQIVVANRIALHGSKVRYRHGTHTHTLTRPGIGYYGWGCAANHVGDPCGRLRNGGTGTYKPPRHYRLLNCQ